MFQVVNTATPGLVGYALADRADAVQLWEPAYTLVKAQRPDIHTLDLNIAKVWGAYAGSGAPPYLGVAAHQEWIDAHRDLDSRSSTAPISWPPTGCWPIRTPRRR